MRRGVLNLNQLDNIIHGGIEASKDEVMVDDFTNQLKRSLSGDAPIYLNPPEIA